MVPISGLASDKYLDNILIATDILLNLLLSLDFLQSCNNRRPANILPESCAAACGL